MKIIGTLVLVVLAACAVDPSASVAEQRSTTCVSEPLTGDADGDIVAQCPPPMLSIDQARALTVGWVQAHFNAASGISVDCARWYNTDGTVQSYQCHLTFNVGALQWSGGCAVFVSGGSLDCFTNDD